MMLSRLTESIRRQEWPAVVIEILILILGVFLGIEVANWNENRQDRATEAHYLTRLHSDVMDAELRMENRRERRDSALLNLATAYQKLIGDEAEALTDAECYALSTSYILTNATLSLLPTLGELKVGPGIEIISDRELRSNVEAVLRGYEQSSEFIGRYGRYMVEPGQAFPDLMALRNFVDDNDELRIESQCDLAGIRENQQFLNAMALNRDIKDALYRYAEPLHANFEALHNRLDQLLEITHQADGS